MDRNKQKPRPARTGQSGKTAGESYVSCSTQPVKDQIPGFAGLDKKTGSAHNSWRQFSVSFHSGTGCQLT
jgi:hypothetical protein